jgi:hypothetical protein
VVGSPAASIAAIFTTLLVLAAASGYASPLAAIVIATVGLALIVIAHRVGRSLATPEPDSSPPAARVSWRLAAGVSVAAVLATIAAGHLILTAPQIDRPKCARTVRLDGGRFGYPLNCDSLEFLRLAHDPGRLLTYHNARQSHPLYVVAAALVTGAARHTFDTRALSQVYGQADSEWTGMIVLNVVAMAAAVTLFALILVRCRVSPVVIVAGSVLLLLSDNMKAFFWTPHTQMLIALVPLIAVIGAGRVLAAEFPPRLSLLVLSGMAAGIGSLAYGAFGIIPVTVAFACIARRVRFRDELVTADTALEVAAPTYGYVLPVIAWAAVCQWVVGSFYSLEVTYYRQFVWPFDRIQEGIGPFFGALATNAGSFARTSLGALVVPLIVLGLAALGVMATSARLRSPSPTRRTTVTACVLTLGGSGLFLYGLGFYAGRIDYLMAPVVLVIASVWIADVRDRSPLVGRALEASMAFTAAIFAVVQLLKHGPYS